MPPSFEQMFRDYDKELADVEHQRVDEVKTAENKWEAQRQGVMRQVATADGERAMWLQNEYESSFGNEANEIAKINKDADQKREGIEEDRKANEQGRVEGTGLKSDPDPAPDQGAPANVNAFGVVPPDPAQQPANPPALESGESPERGTFMQDLAGGAKSFAADAALNLAAIGVALTTQVQSILETFDHESTLAALNQEKLAVTRDASDIQSDSILVKPPAGGGGCRGSGNLQAHGNDRTGRGRAGRRQRREEHSSARAERAPGAGRHFGVRAGIEAATAASTAAGERQREERIEVQVGRPSGKQRRGRLELQATAPARAAAACRIPPAARGLP